MENLNELVKDLKKEKPKRSFIQNQKLMIVLLIITSLFISFFFLMRPTMTLNGIKEMEISYTDPYEEPGATAKFFGKDLSKYIKQNGEVKEGKVGVYQISYDLNYFLFHSKKERIVKIYDKEKPIITLKGETNQSMCPSKIYEEEGYEAIDGYDGDLTNKVVKIENENENEIIYEVEDSSHNKTTVKRIMEKVDKASPQLTLKGITKQYVYLNSTYKESGYTAIDNCEGDITDKVVVTGTVNTKALGKYIITYEVKDTSGNETKITREVNVVNRVVDTSSNGKPGIIYLTFDDGPSGVTSTILDILKEEDVKATFFVTMNGSDNIIKREANEGHTVALHTATHQYSKVYSSIEAYFEDLKIIHDRVERLTGTDSKIIRFPGGSSNTVSRNYSQGIMTALTHEVLNAGYRYYDWNVSSGDAGGAKNANDVYQNVTKNLSKNRINVVLMHDTKGMTRDALRDIIRFGKENGYTFERITEETPMVRHGVNN